MRILVTGAAGFIGSHVSQKLLGRGDEVVGLDNLNAYYDPRPKHDRRDRIRALPGFRFGELIVEDREGLAAQHKMKRVERVVNSAGKSGVRYAVPNTHSHVHTRLLRFSTMPQA